MPRTAPPPSVLYWRVRAVYKFFGPLIDPEKGKPFFNAAAWKKANNVLAEILKGYCSDIPGKVYYTPKLNSRGEPKYDKDGMPLIESQRGTNRDEAWHRVLHRLFRNFGGCGVRLTDVILTEARHRYNHRNAERKRLGFPKIGHYDTWLIDKLQILHELNHGARLYPGWSNTCDFMMTPELTTMVPLHTAELGEVVKSLQLDTARIKLTPDQLYLANKIALPLPFLPIDSSAEKQLFSKVLLEATNGESPDFHELALAFNKRADGVTIFPTLPVYLRLYHTKWKHHKRMADVMQHLGDPLAELRRRLQESADQLSWAQLPIAVAPPTAAPAAASPADATPTSAPAPADAPAAAPTPADAPDAAAPAPAAAAPAPATSAIPFVFAESLVSCNPSLPTVPAYLHAQPSDFVSTVAGIPLQPQGDGSFRTTKAPRRRRACPRCAQFNAGGTACSPGSGGAKYCALFNADGSRIEGERKRSRAARPCQRCTTAGSLSQATECSGRNWHEVACRYYDASGAPKSAE